MSSDNSSSFAASYGVKDYESSHDLVSFDDPKDHHATLSTEVNLADSRTSITDDFQSVFSDSNPTKQTTSVQTNAPNDAKPSSSQTHPIATNADNQTTFGQQSQTSVKAPPMVTQKQLPKLPSKPPVGATAMGNPRIKVSSRSQGRIQHYRGNPSSPSSSSTDSNSSDGSMITVSTYNEPNRHRKYYKSRHHSDHSCKSKRRVRKLTYVFDPKKPSVWISEVENLFEIYHINDDRLRYASVAHNIKPDYIEMMHSYVGEPALKIFSQLKKGLVASFHEKSAETLLYDALNTKLSKEGPIQYLQDIARKMRVPQATTDTAQYLLMRMKFLNGLPPNISAVLSSRPMDTPLPELAQSAERMLSNLSLQKDGAPFQGSHTASTAINEALSTTQRNVSDVNSEKIANLQKEIQKLQKANKNAKSDQGSIHYTTNHQNNKDKTSRKNGKNSNSQSSGSGDNPKADGQGKKADPNRKTVDRRKFKPKIHTNRNYCFYHQVYSADAKYCTRSLNGECTFEKENSELLKEDFLEDSTH